MPPAKAYTNPVSYKAYFPDKTFLGLRGVSKNTPISNVPKTSIMGKRTILTPYLTIGLHRETRINILTAKLVKVSRSSILLTTYPPVYKTILGADKPTGEYTNIFRTPRLHPPLQGTKI